MKKSRFSGEKIVSILPGGAQDVLAVLEVARSRHGTPEHAPHSPHHICTT